MKVFKFGGASVNSVERIKNLAVLLAQYKHEKLLVVISAMGKTTNALEKVVNAFFENNNNDAFTLFNEVKDQHLSICTELLTTNQQPCIQQLKDFFTEIEWLLHDKPIKSYDYYYDQIVCAGELFSTCIISHYLNEKSIINKWMDVRDIIRTDDNFRDASVDWTFTFSRVRTEIIPLFKAFNIVLTQGFIGATDENESTTLGREGSDYSAAIFANLLDATSITIWKDVEYVMNADPKQFPQAIPIPTLNYKEVIEMAYYGAQVIHPKTIKPLQNKNIPLYVRSFINSSHPGTLIQNKPVHSLPPIIVLKEKQVMMEVSSKDFSFIGEQHIGHLYHLFEKFHLKPNLTQNGAISFVCIFDDNQSKIEQLAAEASENLEVQIEKGLSLLTIRHYTNDLFQELTKDKNILLKQQTTKTIQALLR